MDTTKLAEYIIIAVTVIVTISIWLYASHKRGGQAQKLTNEGKALDNEGRKIDNELHKNQLEVLSGLARTRLTSSTAPKELPTPPWDVVDAEVIAEREGNGQRRTSTAAHRSS